MNTVIDVAKWLIVGTLLCVLFFGFNPWSRAVDWIQRLRGRPSIFGYFRTVAEPKKRISTSKVYVATTVRNGDVVQEHVVAKDAHAAKRLAADNLRVEVDEVDVEEIVEKVIRR